MKKIFRYGAWKLKDFFQMILYPHMKHAFGIVSHMTQSERIKLYKLACGSSCIAEIGSYVGASACCFGASVRRGGAGKIICIDTWNNDAMTEGARDTWAEFQKNTSKFEEYIFPVKGFSTDVVDEVRAIAPNIDVLFIDGDHSYEGVKADWNSYKEFLKPGSIVVFHDYGWAEGVRRVVHEDVLKLTSSHDHLPNMWWGVLSEKP